MVLAKKEMSNTASKYYGFLVCFVLYLRGMPNTVCTIYGFFLFFFFSHFFEGYVCGGAGKGVGGG